MSLMDKLKAVGTPKAQTVAESAFFKPKEVVTTIVPIINAAFTGDLTGGVISGLTVIAGPSKHFKSNLALIAVRAYLDKYADAVCIFYDSEFGVSPSYLKAHGIDTTRVLHIPIEHVEHLKFDIVARLKEITDKDHVIIMVDSLGNLASKKEVEDAENEKSVVDLSRAKQIKSLFRIITPHLTMKNIPCLMINHVYEETGPFAKTIVGGGNGVMYSANQVFIVGRSQEKDGTDLKGYNFTINIEKSRFVKEKSKLTFQVTFDGGINKFSGLMDLALESGHCSKPSAGWYVRVNKETGETSDKYRFADTNSIEFWGPVLSDKSFHAFVSSKYKLATVNMHQDEVDE